MTGVRDQMLAKMSGPSAPASPAPSKAGMAYHLTADELSQLNATGEVQAASGCTITADVQGEETNDAAGPEPGEGE